MPQLKSVRFDKERTAELHEGVHIQSLRRLENLTHEEELTIFNFVAYDKDRLNIFVAKDLICVRTSHLGYKELGCMKNCPMYPN